MVRPLYKRVFSTFTAVLLVFGGACDLSWAKQKDEIKSQQKAVLGLTGVHLSADGSTLMFDANKHLTTPENHHLSLLKLPSPYRLLIEIPNTRLSTTQSSFPINRNGIERVEFINNQSPFYSSVRAIVYLSGQESLSHLNAAFKNNTVMIEGFPRQTLAKTDDQVALLTQPQPVSLFPVKSNGRSSHKAQPLPPVAQPLPAIGALPMPVKAVPVPTVGNQSQQTVLAGPINPGTYIIEDVYFRDNRLSIQGSNGSELHIKNRFLLTAPNRLVFDIDNAVLRNKSLMSPITVSSNDIRQIRLGQFDEKTVRVVIEGVSPEQYEALYSGADRSLLTICPYSSTSITKLSANTRLGQVESIDLKRENGGTVLHIEASAPIVHRFIKRDDRIILDLLNEAANPTYINVDSKKYPEIARMRMEPLTEGQPNSKLAITLASANMTVTPSLSPDGKSLDLTIIPNRDELSSSDVSLISNIGLGSAGNAPFPARIVVDAGHGGKDLGANREGVYEKDLNLSLAHMVREALEAKGFKVYMTRSTDVFLPLPEISAITNQILPDLFISIHHNASVNSALNGIETYYYTPQSLALARRVQTREINNVSARDGGVKRAMFYVIHHTNVPAILCEVGYVSNPDERTDLQTYERKAKTARAIADGVVDYLKASVSAKAR